MKADGRSDRGARADAWVGRALSSLLLVLLRGAALLLSPWRIGRLLRTISIPRFEEHRLRTCLTLLGVGVGNAVLVAVILVSRSIEASVASTIEDVSGRADLQVSAGSAGFDASLFDIVRASPGVYKATAVVQQNATVRDARAGGDRLLLLGVDFLNKDDAYFRSDDSSDVEAVRADPLAFLNSSTHLVLSRRFAERLGYKLHDRIALGTPTGTQYFQIWGFVESKGVGRAYAGSVAVMDYQALQVAFGRANNIDRIDIAVGPGWTTGQVASALKSRLGGAFFVEPPERKNGRVAKLLTGLNNGLNLGCVVSLMVGMFLIYNTVSMSVVQRRRELGILRALGATPREVFALITLEGLLLGVAGSALGVAGGVALAHMLLNGVGATVNDIFLQVATNVLRIEPVVLVASFVFGVFATTISALAPAREASRQRPIEVLRASPLSSAEPHFARARPSELAGMLLLVSTWAVLKLRGVDSTPASASIAVATLTLGAALLVPRLVQVLTRVVRPLLAKVAGLEAQLANDNLPRNLLRSSATAGALMMGVGSALGFSTFVGSFRSSVAEWVEQGMPADLWVTSGARFGSVRNTLMTDALEAQLSGISGVQAVEAARLDDIGFRGAPIRLVATSAAIYATRSRLIMLEGTQAGLSAALRAGEVLVSENFGRRFQVRRGDTIALSTKRGTTRFKVAGVQVDYTSDVGTVLIDRATYLRYWDDPRVTAYKLYLQRGADPEAVRTVIQKRHGDQYDLFVLTNREIKAQVLGMLDNVFSVMHALEVVALVIAVLGVVNALLASVLDRVREIGVLRALGMLPHQAQKMIVLEGVLIGIVGIVGGLGLGLALGELVLNHVNTAQTGWRFPYRPDWAWTAEMVLFCVFASALAAWYPASRSAAVRIVQALGYE